MSQLSDPFTMVSFDCEAVSFPSPSYSWSGPNSAAATAATNTLQFFAVFSSFGNYACTATSNGQSVSSDPAVLTGVYSYS